MRLSSDSICMSSICAQTTRPVQGSNSIWQESEIQQVQMPRHHEQKC